jgi:hypothetical protein
MYTKKEQTLYWIAMVCAILFLLLGFIWIYWIALIVAYPLGLLSLILWLQLRTYNRKRNNIIVYLLIAGAIISIGVLTPWLLRMTH